MPSACDDSYSACAGALRAQGAPQFCELRIEAFAHQLTALGIDYDAPYFATSVKDICAHTCAAHGFHSEWYTLRCASPGAGPAQSAGLPVLVPSPAPSLQHTSPQGPASLTDGLLAAPPPPPPPPLSPTLPPYPPNYSPLPPPPPSPPPSPPPPPPSTPPLSPAPTPAPAPPPRLPLPNSPPLHALHTPGSDIAHSRASRPADPPLPRLSTSPPPTPPAPPSLSPPFGFGAALEPSNSSTRPSQTIETDGNHAPHEEASSAFMNVVLVILASVAFVVVLAGARHCLLAQRRKSRNLAYNDCAQLLRSSDRMPAPPESPSVLSSADGGLILSRRPGSSVKCSTEEIQAMCSYS